MTTVSDIFAFSAKHPDYWTEFLSGGDYSAELSDAELRGLEAARRHVEDSIYALLFACGTTLAQKLSTSGVQCRNFQRGATSRNRKVGMTPPPAWQKFYGLDFRLMPDEAGKSIQLCGVLPVKQRHAREVADALSQAGLAHRPGEYGLETLGEALLESLAFDELADNVAGRLAQFCLAIYPQ